MTVRRSSQAIEKDAARVEKLMREGAPTRVIQSKLKLGERTTFRLVARVREHWKREHLLRSETAREERLAQLQETKAMFMRERKALVVDGQILLKGSRYDATIARYDEMINDILGVAAPTQHEVKSAVLVAVAPQVDFSDLPEDALPALVAWADTLPDVAGTPQLAQEVPGGRGRSGGP